MTTINFKEIKDEETASHKQSVDIVETFLEHVKNEPEVQGVICLALSESQFKDLDVYLATCSNRAELSFGASYITKVLLTTWDD